LTRGKRRKKIQDRDRVEGVRGTKGEEEGGRREGGKGERERETF
jgi:hypothetical protein